MDLTWVLLIGVYSGLGLNDTRSADCEGALASAIEMMRTDPGQTSRAGFMQILTTFAPRPGNVLCLGIAGSNVAAIAQREGNLKDAEKFASEAVARLETLGYQDVALARPLQILAGVYIAKGYFDKARKHLALIESIATLGPTDRALLAGAQAAVLEREGRLGEAERKYREAISIWEEAGARAGLGLVSEIENLALLYMKERRGKEAGPLFRRALEIVETAAASPASLRVTVLTNFGVFQIREHEWAGAQAALDRAMAIVLQSEVQSDPRCRLYEAYAVVLRHFGRKREARQIAAQAKDIAMSDPSSQIISFRELRGPLP